MSWYKKAWSGIRKVATFSPLKKIMSWLMPDIPGPEGLRVQRSGSDNALPVVYGEAKVGGVVVHKAITGNANQYLHMIVAFCHGPIERLNPEDIFFNGTRSTALKYSTYSTIVTRTGSPSQDPIPEAVAAIGNWNSAMRGRNVAYAWIRLEMDGEMNVWQGEPEVTAILRGMRVTDPRTGVTGWSENNAVCAYDYLTNSLYGRGLSASRINTSEFIAAANYCDEVTVSQETRTNCWTNYPAAGAPPQTECSTQTNTIESVRYKISALVNTDNTVFDNYRELLSSFRASPNRTNGLVGVSVENAVQSGQEIIAFNRDNITGPIGFTQAPIANRYNQVVIRFPNRLTDFEIDEIVWPPSTSSTYTDWLSEDNGRALRGEFTMNMLADKAQAAQMAEIIAKRSRRGITATISAVGPARLVMPNDIISVTDSDIGWSEKLFRVEARKENTQAGAFEFSLIEHSDDIYPWEGGEWSQQVGGIALGDPSVVATPSNLSIQYDPTLATIGTLTWDADENRFVRQYQVTLLSGGEEIYQRLERGTSHTIPLLDAGSYTIQVRAVSTIERMSEPASILFTLTQPVMPSSLGLTVTNNQITSRPEIAALGLGTQFEFYITPGGGSGANPEPMIRARTAVFAGLIPDAQYTVFVRTVNALGSSSWISETVMTTKDTAELMPVLEEAIDEALLGSSVFDGLIEITDGALDRVEQAEQSIRDIEFDVHVDRISREESDASLIEAMADRVSAQWELQQRQTEGRRLINAVVEVDPDTGTIINKAFQYTDEQFTQASILIDGVEASVTLQAQRIGLVEDELDSAQAELQLLPGVIDARATTIVTNAIAALEPAYAFNFFSSAQGWTAVNGSITPASGSIDVVWGDIENSSLDYDAQENPSLKIVIERTSGTGWVGDLIVEFDDASTQTFAGAIEPINGSELRVVRIVNLQGEASFEGTVNRVRIVLGESSADEFNIESITIGKPDSVVQDIANLQAQVNQASLRIDSNEAAIDLRVTQTTYDANTVTFSNFSQTLDAEQGYIELRGQYQQIIDDNVIAKANEASIVIDGFGGTITALAQTIEDNRLDAEQQINQVSLELDSVDGRIRQQAFSVFRVREDVDSQGAEGLIADADYYSFKWGQIEQNTGFSFAVQELQAVTGPDGSIAQNIIQLGAQFNTLSNNFGAFVTSTEQAIANNEQAIASVETSLQAEIAGAEASAVAQAADNLNARVGYCSIGGEPSTHDTPSACSAAGGTWIPAPLGESVRALRVETENGTATFAQIGQAFVNEGGEPFAKGAMLTNVDGRVSGYINTNTGDFSSIDMVANQFRWGVESGGNFVPYLSMEDVGGNPMATFRGRLVVDGTPISNAQDIRNIDGVRFVSGRYIGITGNPTARFTDLAGRAPISGDMIQQTAPATGAVVNTSVHRFTGSIWTTDNSSFVVSGGMVATGTIRGPSFETSNFVSQLSGARMTNDGLIETMSSSGDSVVAIDATAPNGLLMWVGDKSIARSNRHAYNSSYYVDTSGGYMRPLFQKVVADGTSSNPSTGGLQTLFSTTVLAPCLPVSGSLDVTISLSIREPVISSSVQNTTLFLDLLDAPNGNIVTNIAIHPKMDGVRLGTPSNRFDNRLNFTVSSPLPGGTEGFNVSYFLRLRRSDSSGGGGFIAYQITFESRFTPNVLKTFAV